MTVPDREPSPSAAEVRSEYEVEKGLPRVVDDIYPGLSVHDHRVTGSITVDHSRLPLWAIAGTAVTHGWDYVEEGWSPSDYGFDRHALGRFLGDLFEHRGEFARLILMLAAVEASNRTRRNSKDWTTVARQRKRLADQLRRCLAALDPPQEPR